METRTEPRHLSYVCGWPPAMGNTRQSTLLTPPWRSLAKNVRVLSLEQSILEYRYSGIQKIVGTSFVSLVHGQLQTTQ